MRHRSHLARITLGLVAFCSIAHAGACLDFDSLSGGVPEDAGAPDRTELDASLDSSDADASARRIVLRGTAQAGPTSANDALALTVPPGVQPGELMLLALFNSRGRPTPTFTPDAGAAAWTLRASVRVSCEDAGPPNNGAGLVVLSKIASEAEESFSVIFDVQSVSVDRSSAILAVWGRTHPTSPIDTEAFTGAHDLVAPGLTTTAPNAQLVAFFMTPEGTGASWTPPNGMTAWASTGVVALFDEPLGPSSGPTGIRAAQTTATTNCGAAAMIALRPSP